jgi:predicted nucleic acid-binding Zn ribbon protein
MSSGDHRWCKRRRNREKRHVARDKMMMMMIIIIIVIMIMIMKVELLEFPVFLELLFFI